MDNGFRRFKRKIRLSAIVRALLMGLSLGVIAVAGQWLVAKLTAADPNFVRYGIVGAVIALASAVLLLLVMLPTDKRLARQLDNKLQMHEKVQTMVAFRGDESEMVTLQRENTQELLMQIPTRKARRKSAWLSMILPVAACACMAVAFLVPAKADTPDDPTDKTGWFLSVYDERKLNDLITYVQTSGMQQEPKDGIVAELEDLLAELKAIKKKAVMQETVVKCIEDIHKIAKVCHTHTTTVRALRGAADENAAELGKKIATLDANTLTAFMEDLKGKMSKNSEGEEKAGELRKSQIASPMASEILRALAASGESAENPLYKAVEELANSLATVTDDTSDFELQELLKKGETAIIDAMRQPGVDVSVERYTINRLMEIFGIDGTKLSQDILDAFETGEISGKPNLGDDDEKGSSPGGVGKGDTIYGSDDTIFDPELNKQVKYGEVINGYNKTIYDLITEGVLSPEVEEMLTKYYAELWRPVQDSSENQG